jgi:hypothetical protein
LPGSLGGRFTPPVRIINLHVGLDLTYRTEGASFGHRFSHADWAAIEALRAHLPADVAVCFDTPDFGAPVRIKTVALKQSTLALDRFLGDNAQLLPATYQFKLERFPVPGVPAGDFDTGGISGLQLPGDPDHFYRLSAGLNECVLKKMGCGSDGRGVIVEERDLRGCTELPTENAGIIQIRRRAAKTTLRRALRDIAAFAERVSSPELTKIVG